MRLALDTNTYTALCNGREETAELIETAEEVLVPFIVLAELQAGFSHGKRGLENERRLAHFRNSRRSPGCLGGRPPRAHLGRRSPTDRRWLDAAQGIAATNR